jgi:hypothetical protein
MPDAGMSAAPAIVATTMSFFMVTSREEGRT